MTDRLDPILLSPPELGPLEAQLVMQAIDSNWIAPVGPDLDAFEEELGVATGGRHVCAVSSGTAAIHLGLKLLGVKEGDKVVCSSLTFVASANPIRYCGAEPVFVDSDPETWCMSVPALERKLRSMAEAGSVPRACIAVSLYGQPADLPAICDLCHQFGVKVLDEAAEGLGATHGDRMVGTFGDLGVYSFNGNKIITTSGGGALVSRDPELISKARFMATQARDASPIGAYNHSELGYNYRLSNLLAALGRGQLRVLDDRIEKRRRIFEGYRTGLEEIPNVSWMPEAAYGRSTRWLSCCLLESRGMRDRILKQFADARIDARPVWCPMHAQSLYDSCDYESHLPEHDVSRDLFDRGLCLPSGSGLTRLQQSRVIEALRTALA
ncbi:MAG: aminotransferase class I/II-fold pyridoxal phosphate-dependent enzyme [Planctomycetota bacterium]|nr:aminotransferase class I/II-fold pyridoxal phosphate-dependent enzyme [Planctomycetota bacterium]